MPPDATREPIDYVSTYEHGVDAKRRVHVPHKWLRDNQLEKIVYHLFLWRTAPNAYYLLAFPPERWRRFSDAINARPFSDPVARKQRGWLSRFSDAVSPDTAGRITIPANLAELAGIRDKVVLCGMSDYFEVWAAENYTAETAAQFLESNDPETLFAGM